MVGLSSLRAALSPEGRPIFLLVYSALITAGLVAVGSARFAACGTLFFNEWCPHTFGSTLSRAVWLGYFSVGLGAALVAMTFGWPRVVAAIPKLDRRLGWAFAVFPLGLAATLTIALGEWYILLFAASHGATLRPRTAARANGWRVGRRAALRYVGNRGDDCLSRTARRLVAEYPAGERHFRNCRLLRRIAAE